MTTKNRALTLAVVQAYYGCATAGGRCDSGVGDARRFVLRDADRRTNCRSCAKPITCRAKWNRESGWRALVVEAALISR